MIDPNNPVYFLPEKTGSIEGPATSTSSLMSPDTSKRRFSVLSPPPDRSR
jgi:hypothetical protein